MYDYDSVQVPVLADIQWQGQPRKAMLFGNRNGFFYVLDRTTASSCSGKPFTKVTWTTGLDAKGRPQNMVPLSEDGVPDLSGRAGRHQLVFAVVQSAHRAVLGVPKGKKEGGSPPPRGGRHISHLQSGRAKKKKGSGSPARCRPCRFAC